MAKSLVLASALASGARGSYGKPAALRGGAGLGVFGPLNFMRSVGQGACAGLLSLIGSMHLLAAWPAENRSISGFLNTDATGVEGLVEASLAGGLPGLIEILGAAALFLSAGRGVGRLIGLMGFLAIVAAHVNGVTHEELWGQAGAVLEYLAQTAEKIQASQAS